MRAAEPRTPLLTRTPVWIGATSCLLFLAAYLATNQWTIAYLVIGLGLVGMAVRLLGMSLTDLVLVTSPFMFFPPDLPPINVAVSDLLFPLLLGSTLVQQVTTTKRPDGIRPLLAYAATFFFVICCVTALASLRDSSFEDDLAIVDIMKLLVVLAYLVVIATALASQTRAALLRTLRLWVWVAVALASGSLAGLVPSDGYRSLGYFQDPNLYAGYLLVSLAIASVLVAERQLPFWPILMILILGGILSTGSRGGIVSTAIVVLAALLGIALTRVGLTITLVIVSLGTVLLFAPWQEWAAQLPGAERLLSSSQAGTDPRWGLWSKAYELWSEHPITGIGIGQFPRFSAGLTPFRGGLDGQVAHNTYLSLAAETGFIGLGLFMCGATALSVRILRAAHLTWSTRWSILLGVVALASTMLTINLQNLRYMWIYAAIAWVMSTRGGPMDDKDELSPEGASATARSRPQVGSVDVIA